MSPHTQNISGRPVLSFMCVQFIIESPREQPESAISEADGNLITASATGGLLWAKQILAHLNVFQEDTLEAWYQYFSTGRPEQFYALMQTLPTANSALQ